MIRNMIALASPQWTPLPYTGKKGCYVAVQPDDASKFRIIRICEELGIGIDHRKLHCTIVYSPEGAPEEQKIRESGVLDGTHTAIISHVQFWPGHDNKGYLSLSLVSTDLHKAFQRMQSLGARHTYHPYNPHVTLLSGVDMNEDFERRMQDVNRYLETEGVRIFFNSTTLSDMDD